MPSVLKRSASALSVLNLIERGALTQSHAPPLENAEGTPTQTQKEVLQKVPQKRQVLQKMPPLLGAESEERGE